MDKIIMTMGERITESRKKCGLTQQALADKIDGMTVQMINSYERNKQTPSMKNIIKISEVLNVSLDYLCKGEKKDVALTVEPYTLKTFGDIIMTFAILDNTDIFKLEVCSENMHHTVSLKTHHEAIYQISKDYKTLREAKGLIGEQRFFDSLKELIEKYSADIFSI